MNKKEGRLNIMGIDFHNTKYGQIFFEVQLPQLIREIGRLANAVENNNQLLFDAQKENKSKIYCDVLTCTNRSKDGFCTKDAVALNSDSICEDRSNEETTK